MSDNETPKRLTPSQRLVIEKLLTSGSIEEAAKQADVARSSVYRWMRDEFFISHLKTAEAEAIEGLSRALTGLGALAVEALRDALGDSKISIRLRSAEIITDRLLKVRELLEFEQRLRKLEERSANEE